MDDENTSIATQTGTEGQPEKTYTQAEVDELLQKEGDRRVTAALQKADAKHKEAEKLAKMNEREKYEYELQQREQALIEKENALTMAENKAAASKILAADGLQNLVDFVVGTDADEMNGKIKLLRKEFGAAVKAEVEKRLGGKPPTKNDNPDPTKITREQFNRMSIAEQQRLFDTDPELFEALANI